MTADRFLAVDQGNSFYKLSLFEGEALAEVCRIPADDAEEVFSVVERWAPSCGAFCSVGHIDPRILESLRLAMDGRFLVLSHSTPLPIAVRYATPDTLGLDRVALAAGAAAICKGQTVAVADAGTAVTLDVVSAEPAFLGGRISPGLRLRFEALSRHTAALPLVDCGGDVPLLGDSTAACIRAGVVGGLCNEIEATFRQMADSYGCSLLVLTGGDADILFKSISSRIPAVHVPDLMAQGLLYIYQYNENL